MYVVLIHKRLFFWNLNSVPAKMCIVLYRKLIAGLIYNNFEFNKASEKIVKYCGIIFWFLHGSYKWIIMLEKCGRPNLTIFHLIWIIDTYGIWKNPGVRFRATS